MINYIFTLRNRTLTLQYGGAESEAEKIALSDTNDELSYRSLFVAVRHGLEELAHHAGFVDPTNNRSWDSAKLAASLNQGELQIRLVGEEREANVAAFYIRNELALEQDVEVESVQGAESVYETFGFATDLGPLEQFGRVLRSFQGVEDKLDYVKELREQSEELDPNIVEKQRFRIGVLGQTGAGKSTFLNAILGQHILSLHEDICTGTIIQIEYADSPKDEGLRVSFVSEEAYQQRKSATQKAIDALKKKKLDVHELRAETLKYEAELEQFENHQHHIRTQENKFPISALDKFVSVASENVLPELVTEVRVALHRPILKYVTLVDTPGLRDPNPQRRRLGINAVAKLDGWIYLVEADGKPKSTVKEDLKEIREVANNPNGFILLSKADAFTPPDIEGPLDQQLSTRRKTYQEYSKHEISFCAAMGPEQVTILREERSVEKKQRILERLLNSSYGFPFIRRHISNPSTSFLAEDTLKNGFKECLGVAYNEGEYVLISDILLESSAVIPALRQLAYLLEETILSSELKRGREHLKNVIDSRINWLQKRKGFLNEQLAACDDLNKTRSIMQTKKGALSTAQKKLEEAKTSKNQLLKGLKSEYITLSELVDKKKKVLGGRLALTIKEKLRNKYHFTLRGERRVEIFNNVDIPLNRALIAQLHKISTDFNSRVSTSNAASEAFKIKVIFDKELKGLSLLSDEQHMIEGEERLFQLFSTTIDKMTKEAIKSLNSRVCDIRANARKKLRKLEALATKELNHWVKRFEDEVTRLENEIGALEEQFHDITNNISASRDALESQLDVVGRDLGAVVQFKSDLPGLLDGVASNDTKSARRRSVTA